MEFTKIDYLIGRTPLSVSINGDNNELIFELEGGDIVRFYHSQDCCESVDIEDVVGDLSDLVGSPILLAEEACSTRPEHETEEDYHESNTWTYYKFATIKGYVDVRWWGSSNGYYSEDVNMDINGKSQWKITMGN